MESFRDPREYSAYGLLLRSDIELPELDPGNRGSVVWVRRGEVYGLPEIPKEKIRVYQANPAEVRIRYRERGSLLIRGGSEIIFDPLPAASSRNIRQMVLGPGLAMILHQRSYLVLHASAVARGKKVIAFLGASGQGKSTTAAVLYKRGYRLIADDVLPVSFRGDRPLVRAGSPILKLWPESVELIGDDPLALPLVNDYREKRARPAGQKPLSGLLPLHRVYVLAQGPAVQVEKLRSGEAMVELVRHSYINKFWFLLDATQKRALHFQQCAALAKAIGVYRLQRKLKFEMLEDVANVIDQEPPLSYRSAAP